MTAVASLYNAFSAQQPFQQGKETNRFGGYFRRHAHRIDIGEDVWCRERQKKDEF